MAEPQRQQGRFVWRELTTPDVARSKAFYGELLGWTFQDMDMGPGGIYPVIHVGETGVGGLFGAPPGTEITPSWLSYVAVPSVDEVVARTTARGGRVHRPAQDIPEVGRFAVLADPQGAVFLPFRPFPPDGGSAPPERLPPGSFCWETLTTRDPQAAIAFYREVIGWGLGDGPDGPGTVFTAGGGPVADVTASQPGEPPHWATWVIVERLAATRARVAGLGGRMVLEELAVPGVGTVAVLADPHGATLGLLEPEPAR